MKTTLHLLLAATAALCTASTGQAATRYVRSTASGANNGTSWANAYTRLQDALAVAVSGDQIWIAAGTYKPSSTSDRSQSFTVSSGVGLYGGFAGTESSLGERTTAAGASTLSGDLLGNDNGSRARTESTRLDNAYNVVRVTGASSTVTFDGLTIQSGHSETYGDEYDRGGGIHFLAEAQGTVVIHNCIIRWNTARSSAGWCDDSNHAFTVTSTQLIQNQAERGGAAGFGAAFTIKNSTFFQNRCENSRDGYQWGGGLFIANGTGQIINCVFASNYAAEEGGGVYNHGNSTFINCTFVGNSAVRWSSALHDRTNTASVRNCIFWANSGTSHPISADGGNPGTKAYNSLIQDGYSVGGSQAIISSNPLFIDSSNPAGADGIFGTIDDGLRLATNSPAVNTGSNAYLPGGTNTDIKGAARIAETTVDMGAYEGAYGITSPAITSQPLSISIKITETASFSVAAEGVGTLTYQWRKNGSDLPQATGATLNLGSVNKMHEGTYDVVVTDDNGSVTSEGATLTVISPAIFTEPSSRSGYAGQSSSFIVVAAGTGTVSYQWRKNGVNIPYATSSTLTLVPLNYRSPGDYDVVVSDDHGSATSSAATLTVLSPAPNVSITPGDSEVAPGAGLTFTATVATGIPPFTYQWRRNGTPIAKATNALLVLTNLQRSQVGVYDVVVKNAHGLDVSNTARLSMPPLVPVEGSPASTTVDPAGTATFTVNVPGATAWQWLKNGTPIKGATTSTLDVPNVDASSAGLYSVTVTTPNGKVTTAPAQLRVNDTGLLIYKLTGTGKAYEGPAATNAALSGFLVLDRSGQRGGLIIGSKRGSQNIHNLEIHEDLETQSTGPVPKSQTVMSELVAGEFALWMDGTDGLLTVSKTDKAVGPATLKGFANSIFTGDGVRIETVNLSLVFDAANSTPARLYQETVEQAMSRISQDMQAKGSALIE